MSDRVNVSPLQLTTTRHKRFPDEAQPHVRRTISWKVMGLWSFLCNNGITIGVNQKRNVSDKL